MPIQDLFATPIFVKDIEGPELSEIQDQIKAILPRLDSTAKTAPWSDSIATTWIQGRNNVIEDYLLDKMAFAIINAGAEFLTALEYKGPGLRTDQSWVNWIKKGGFQFDHVHPMSRMSGVYYYQTSEDDGDLRFTNPYPHQQMGMWPYDGNIMPTYAVQPKVGRIVLWPSWLSHRVEPNCTDYDRISLSFTLK